MFESKTIIIVLSIAFIDLSRSQGLFGGTPIDSLFRGQQSPIDRLPGIGACDRIASRGVGNCMENFLPTNILSSFTGGPRSGSGGDICCSYSKYKACINGLHNGLRLAMDKQKCPKSYSTQIIKSMGDSFVGLPLKTACGNGGQGKSKCPKTGNSKPKRTQNTRRRGDNSPNNDNFQPVRDIFGGTANRGDGNPILDPFRDILNRGRETFEQGVSSMVGGIQNTLNGLANIGRPRN